MSEEQKPILAIKGFDKNLVCHPSGGEPFQYEIGKTYEMDGPAVACKTGFHAISGYPLEVLGYYPPATSRYCAVEQSGQLARHEEDSKLASTVLKVGAEINLAGLIKLAIEYTTSRCKPIDPNSPAYSTEANGAATASGDQGAATASGYQGAATAEGKHSVAMTSGFNGKAKGIEGAALFLTYRDPDAEDDEYGRILHAKAVIVGKDGVKPMVFYALNSSGEIIEAE